MNDILIKLLEQTPVVIVLGLAVYAVWQDGRRREKEFQKEREHHKLELKEKATVLAPVQEGVPFLGFRVYPNLIRLKPENKKRALSTLKIRTRAFKAGEISEEDYSQSLMSTTEHLKIANTNNFRKDVFARTFF